MTEEEIKRYVQMLIDASDSDRIIEILSDVKENLICQDIKDIHQEIIKLISAIEEKLNNAKKSGLQEEVNHLNSTIDTCYEFLAAEKYELFGENLTEQELTPKQMVFVKSDDGTFYVNLDMENTNHSNDIYNKLQNVFEFIQSGRQANNLTTIKKFRNNKNYKNIIEYKNAEVSVYTKTLVDNIIGVIGIRIKKDNNPKSILTFLNKRCEIIAQGHAIEKMSEMIVNGQKEELLAQSQEELNKILQKKVENKNTIEKKSLAEKAKQKKETTKSIIKKAISSSKLNKQWMAKYNLAKKYYEKNGDLKISKSYVDPKTKIKLGSWLYNQKQAYKNGKMPEERIRLLEEIGMIWSVRSHEKKNEEKSKIEEKQQVEEIEILDLYPEENIKSEEISTNKFQPSIDTEATLKNNEAQTNLEDEISQVYEGLLKMNPDELNEFVIQLENVELPSYKGKK